MLHDPMIFTAITHKYHRSPVALITGYSIICLWEEGFCHRVFFGVVFGTPGHTHVDVPVIGEENIDEEIRIGGERSSNSLLW